MEYVFTGPHPVEDEAGELVHPGDVREFEEEPGWGPWRRLDPEPTPPSPDLPKPAATALKGTEGGM